MLLRPARAGSRLPRANRHNRRSFGGQPLLRRAALAAAATSGGDLPRGCVTCCCSVSTGSTIRRRACCTWHRPSDATSGTRSLPPSRECASAGRAQSLHQSVEHGVLVADQPNRNLPLPSPTPRGGVYTNDPCRRARGVARALAEQLAMAAARRGGELAPHWAAAGRRLKHLLRRSRRRARRRPASVSQRRSRTSNGRSRSGTPSARRGRACGIDLAAALHWQRRWPAKRALRSRAAWSSPTSDRSSSGRRPAPRGDPACGPGRVPLRDRQQRGWTRRSLSVRSSSVPSRAALAGAPIRWRHSRAD